VVMFVDLDDFKFVNDMYGHPAGDAMLVEVATRLQACTRASDLTARLGGDEFAILLDDGPDLSNASRVAARIAEILRLPFSIGEVQTHVSASIGIAAGSQGDSAEDLLRQADVAMYSAKAAGKGRWVVYKPAMLRTVRSRHDVGAELQLAVDRGEFQLRYQPIVSLESGGIVGAEALVRWNHPTRGEVGPDEFIGTAEENAIIVPIGRWVLHEACREAAGWGVMHASSAPWVAANLSARQLLHPTLIEDVTSALAASGLAPTSLVLEVTESVLLHDADAAIEVLGKLRGLGIRIALDDFGTGYSSLSYLHRFPCDTIKVDRSLVRDSGVNGSTPLILRSIIALAHELGKEVVAEGVETAADASYLRSIGCEYGQGYYYGEPMAAKDVGSLLAALASHRKRKERERAREPQTPKGLEVQAPGATILKALPAPGASS